MISIRNAKYAKQGLKDLIEYIQIFRDTARMTMVEIGSYVGDSAEIFADYFKTVYCVDPWQNDYDINDAASWQHNMKVVEEQFDELVERKPNIIKMKMTSQQACIQIERADFVYIDGLHTFTGVSEDINIWTTKLKPFDFIGGHDYGNKHHPGVKPAVDAFYIPDKTFRDTSWVKQL